jgi:hypothetical protein
MKQILKQLLTGKDNETYDLGRVTWMLGTFAILIFAAYQITSAQVSLRELAEALGIVSGANGASIFMKKDTEPQ